MKLCPGLHSQSVPELGRTPASHSPSHYTTAPEEKGLESSFLSFKTSSRLIGELL